MSVAARRSNGFHQVSHTHRLLFDKERLAAAPRAAQHWIEGSVGRYPVATLCAALAAGLVLGWLIKRR